MQIEVLTLREIRMRLKAPFETSFGVMQDRRIVLVEVVADGISGWGEVTTGETPSYNSETTDTAWHVISDFIAPAVVGKSLANAAEFPLLMNGIRGHEMAKAGVENAIWDAEARLKEIPLFQLLGGTQEEIACGVSLGIRENPESLVKRIENELRDGYQRIKIKIKPGKDLEFISAARNRLPDIQLMVDANSAYRLEDAAHLQKFDDYNLMMIEQPLAWDDIFEHSKLQAKLRTPICLDECIHNLQQARTALELKACRILNIKLGRVGGHTEARRIAEFCKKNQVPVWCGGMLESGVGRAHNIAMSTLPGFTLPGDVSASRRYWDEDIIDPEVEVTPKGTIQVPTAPGIGYTVRRSRVEALTVRSATFPANASISVLTARL